jgi:ElaB/YqjD/DUF883 family membrane-anchored ribosome-binding protein
MAEENQMNQTPAVSPQAGLGQQTPRQQIESASPDQGHTLESSEQYRTEDSRSASGVSGREVLHETKQRLQTLKQDTDAYVRKNPAKAVFTALGIGFVLGLMRRR